LTAEEIVSGKEEKKGANLQSIGTKRGEEARRHADVTAQGGGGEVGVGAEAGESV
jgi:hypothetical protein